MKVALQTHHKVKAVSTLFSSDGALIYVYSEFMSLYKYFIFDLFLYVCFHSQASYHFMFVMKIRQQILTSTKITA